jgi:hypothetical protein
MQGLVEITHIVDREGKLVPRTKSKAGDRAIIDRDLNADIGAHMARRGISLSDPDNTLLFVNARTGGLLTYGSWRNTWLKALTKAGLDWRKKNRHHLGHHDLRSMNRSIMNEVGVDPTTARARFGHAGTRQEQMDDLYARTSDRQNRLASERIHTRVRRVRPENLEKTGEKTGENRRTTGE